MLTIARLVSLAVAFLSTVEAHGYLYEPSPTWVNDYANVSYVVGIDYYWEEVGSGGDQVGKFKELAEEKGMSVRDVLLEMAPDYPCGHTLEDGTAQDIPSDGLVQFMGNNGGGFTHQGPCEVWFDDTMVLHGDNCEDEYPGGDVGTTDYSQMTVDYTQCSGDCVLRFYWLGFQNEMWQAYINCVPLKGSSTSTSVASDADTTSSTSESTTATTSTTTSLSDDSTSTTSAPAATTAAPSTTTATTTSSSGASTSTTAATSTTTSSSTSTATSTTTAPAAADSTSSVAGTVQPAGSSAGYWSGGWGGNAGGFSNGGWGGRQ